jgi:hypothetical protein
MLEISVSNISVDVKESLLLASYVKKDCHKVLAI